MTDTLTIALAQLDCTVGDVAGNIARIGAARDEAAGLGADLAIFSELVVSGYPPEDLVLKPIFQDAVEAAVRSFAPSTKGGPPLTAPGPAPSFL